MLDVKEPMELNGSLECKHVVVVAVVGERNKNEMESCKLELASRMRMKAGIELLCSRRSMAP